MRKVLVIGSGGRCHAICKKLRESTKVNQIYCAPGNAGTSEVAINVPYQVTEIDKLLNFALKEEIDLTVVGPEQSLELGVVDKFEEAGLKIFGPRKDAALIETSKSFAKDLMKKYDIPTADYEIFTNYDDCIKYLESCSYPIVIKYDGLAAGKGVTIPSDFESAKKDIDEIFLDNKYSTSKVVIEEFLAGEEFSYMVFTDGTNVYPMIPSQDHKRAYDNDLGPNTGGMGAYTGLSFLTKEDEEYALEHIMKKTVSALKSENKEFKGVLYGGLIKTANGIKVIEFNARFGDPETEVVLSSLISDLYDVFYDIIENKAPTLIWDKRPTLGVVLAAKGYPGDYKKGGIINILKLVDGYIYHMGTKIVDGNLTINGGRVLMVVNKGFTLEEAIVNTYNMIKDIDCDDLFYRKDIGAKSLKE